MTDEVKELRERVRTFLESAYSAGEYGQENKHTIADDYSDKIMSSLVNELVPQLAHLATSPADSDKSVTREWLHSVGFTTYIHWPSIELHDGKYLLEWRGAGLWIENVPLVLATTRGAVRNLCRALGIPLKESEATHAD